MNRNQERNLENHNPDPDLRAEEDHNTDLGTLNITTAIQDPDPQHWKCHTQKNFVLRAQEFISM